MANNTCARPPALYQGDGSTTKYSFAFPYIETEDVAVFLWDSPTESFELCTRIGNKNVCSGSKTEYYFTSATPVDITFCVAPGKPPTDRPDDFSNVIIIRQTDICQMVAYFYPGSPVRAQDLNNNFTQVLLALQDVEGRLYQFIENYKGFVRITGDVMEGGPLDMNEFQLTGLRDGIKETDAVNKRQLDNLKDYVDDEIEDLDNELRDWTTKEFVNVTGDTMTGELKMSGESVKEVRWPLDSGDATNKAYVDAIFNGTGGDLSALPVVRAIFTARGGETVLDPIPNITPGNEIVTVNGSTLTPNDDYTIQGKDTITLREPLIPGDLTMILCYNSVKVVEVSSNFETYPFTRWVDTATAGQTVFQGLGDGTVTLGYSPGYEQVTLNGSRLVRDVDYAANDKLSVNLVQGALKGDILEVLCGNYLKTGDQESYAASDISYSYPDGVSSNVQDRLEQYVSVKDFGAVGNGVVDDTAAIQSAIDSQAPTINFPSGTYVVKKTINLRSNQTLIGTGSAVINNQSSSEVFFGLGISYSRLENLEFINQSNIVYSILYDSNDLNCFGPELVKLKFTNGVGRGCIRVTSTNWEDEDWQLYNQPDMNTWNRWNNPVLDQIEVKNFSNTNAGSSTVSVTGFSDGTLSNFNLTNITERGIALAFFVGCNIKTLNIRTKAGTDGAGDVLSGSNPHGIYIRTYKGCNLEGLYVDYEDNIGACWGLRLSRGCYYGTFSNIVVHSTNKATGIGGIGFLGGEYNTFSSGSLITALNTLHIAGHASATPGAADSSFAHCRHNSFSGFTIRSAVRQGIQTWAAGVPTADGESIVSNINISDCVISSEGNVQRLVYFPCGYDCQFVGNILDVQSTDEAAVVLQRDSRNPPESFQWNISNNTFTLADGEYGVLALESGDTSAAKPTRNTVISNNKFIGGQVSFSNEVGLPFYFTNNNSTSRSGVDIRTTDITSNPSSRKDQVVVSNNLFKPNSSGSSLSCYVKVDYLDYSHNTVIGGGDSSIPGGYAIRNGTDTGFFKLFNISHNLIFVRTKAFRDLWDDDRVKMSFNDVTELIDSEIGSNVDQQYNIFRNTSTFISKLRDTFK